MRRRCSALLVGLAAMGMGLASGPVTAAADQTGTVAVAGQLPNLFAPSITTTVLSDPANHLILQTDVGHYGLPPCANVYPAWLPLIALDSDTFAVKAKGCGGDRAPNGTSDEPVVAIDSRDQVLFFSSDTYQSYGTGSAVPTQGDSIVAVSERTLQVVGSWPLPATAAPVISGLSWYAPTDRLIVLTASASPQTSPGGLPVTATMSVVSYDARTLVATASGAGSPDWTVPVIPGCKWAMYTSFTQPNAERSLDLPDIFIPCQLTSSNANQIDGVAKLHLGTAGCTGGDLCPDTPAQVQIAAAPGLAPEFLFDPGSDRAFMPQQGSSGTDLLVYDGRTPSGDFIGRAGVAQTQGQAINPDGNCVMFNLDAQTGRLYATGPPALVAIDGRRTPLAPGSQFPNLGGQVQYMSLPVLPPDAVHPHPRILVDYLQGGTPDPRYGCNVPGTTSPVTQDHFTVLEDTRALTTDPAATSVDGNTSSGATPAGSLSSTSYTGTARGFGVHTVWAGSYGGAINNVLQGTFVNGNSLPLGSGTRDLVAGWVERAHLQDGTALAAAIAAGDGNNTTSSAIQQCTDTQSLGSCTGQPIPPAGSTPTGQQWPVMEAACSSPDTAPHDAGGLYTTTWTNQPAPNPPTSTSAQVPNSGSLAAAHASCASAQPIAGSVAASASLADLSSGSAGTPTLTVASATSQSSVQPGGSSAGVISTTTSTARGVRLDFGGGTYLEIGSIIQTASATARGLSGTASATRTVTISNVTVSQNGTATVFCAVACTGDPQGVITAINAQLPGIAALSLPQPYTPFGGSSTAINGSPGGYQSIVEPQPAEQYGDQLFNSMTTASGETSILPALRLVVYNDGQYQLDRQVIDFAGVENDAEQGVTVIPPPPPLPPQSSFTTQALQAAAGAIAPASASVAAHGGTSGGGGLVAAILQTIQRVFNGILWMFRSPLDALRTLAFFALLGTPLVLMARRRLQLNDMAGAAA